ncbi:MAG: glutamine--tRNA ligase/YqeY domain fusion protein [Deltaproteobacteria bacterium]|nr:glutamine--tRNA ligase/YqeY domain fusion protein [Deltaproteobacteria bacterium]
MPEGNLEGCDCSGESRVNFIQAQIDDDLKAGKNEARVHTRFPPEPNGYLHIGHAKSICLNFGLAEIFKGFCNLRFDDTNPSKEEVEYVESIKEDVRWLGFDWDGREFFASDYFEKLYAYAVQLIKDGKAYVCDLSPEATREYRGTLKEAGRNSPYRERSVAENLDLFARMRAGEFADGSRVLRAKIDMAAGNMNMRDPVIYRILRAHHHRTGDAWCIYPMYDFAHGLSDAIEGITHSICTLEFEDHRPLYDWFIEQLPVPCRPRQIEFARLNLSYTVMSKRKLLKLVNDGLVDGWDDPRLPTLSGLRRRGFSPASIRNFCERIGVAKRNSMVDVALLEHAVREDLNRIASRYMAVLQPLKLIIDNYPEGQVEELDAVNHPEDPAAGSRKIPFARELYVERDDFMEEAPKKFYRLTPGREVRLRYAYYIRCEWVEKDAEGKVTVLHCSYDPQSRGGSSADGRKVKATLHWVAAPTAVNAEVRLYDRLFSEPDPGSEKDGGSFTEKINSGSLVVLKDCKLEPALAEVEAGVSVQFERLGYFIPDNRQRPLSSAGPVFNRTVTLRDDWLKSQSK